MNQTVTPLLEGEELQNWLTQEGFPCNDINAAAQHGLTPLMKASRAGDAAKVAALLQRGARLDIRNADGNNVLWLACVGANLEVIDALIKAGIDIDNQNDNGATCLMYAASAGKDAVVKALLAAGANSKLKSLDDYTALDMAATLPCLQLLRKTDS
jgi:thiosulfate/3-mercaptopyruvate sulfurtransferase